MSIQEVVNIVRNYEEVMNTVGSRSSALQLMCCCQAVTGVQCISWLMDESLVAACVASTKWAQL